MDRTLLRDVSFFLLALILSAFATQRLFPLVYADTTQDEIDLRCVNECVKQNSPFETCINRCRKF